MSNNQHTNIQQPAAVEMHVSTDAAYCAIQYGTGIDEAVSAAHQEIRWAMDRDDAKLELYDIVNVRP